MSQGRNLLHPARLVLLLLLLASLSLALAGVAGAEGAPYKQIPGYPKYGCYDVAVAGIGMWGGESTYTQVLDVPGPVVDAYLMWLGTIDDGEPNGPNQSHLFYNGTQVTGTLVDQKLNTAGKNPWYLWRADVGPNGANLVKQGLNKFKLTGWVPLPPASMNGASLVVVYSTGACTKANKIDLLDTMDYYWERLRTSLEPTTDAMVFTFDPAPEERIVTLWLSHAGTDQKNLTYVSGGGYCRPEKIWAASGSGTPPAAIMQWGPSSKGINGGQVIVDNAFVQDACGITKIYAPATEIIGWKPGLGAVPNTGGFIAPEWSLIRLKVRVPAGASWLALQAESVYTDPNEPIDQSGESGAWFGQAVIPLFNPELKITKTDGVAKANPGDTLTYLLDYENYGYGPAFDTTIVDTLPPNVTFQSATAGGVYNAANRTVTWNLGTVNIGVKGQVAVTVKLDPVFEAGTTVLKNVATISTTSPGEQNLADNATEDLTEVFAQVQLALNKTAAPEPVDAGGDLTYTLNWTIGGNAFAPAATLVDTLPANVVFVSASDGGVYNQATHTVTWNLGRVTPVKTGQYTIAVKVKTPLYNGTTLTNSAVLSDGIAPGVPGGADDVTSSVVTTVRADHALAISKVDDPDPVDAGANLTYTITWAVTGNEPSPNAVIVDTLPANVTFVSASGGGIFDPATRTIRWNLGELLTPQNGEFVVVVQVNSPLYNNTLLTNVVNFRDDDPGTPPVQATVETTVRADHELTITKTDSPDPVEKGAQLTYTINWSVTGNEPADNVVISDPLPFGTQFVSASGGGVFNPATGVVTWNLGNKVPGDSGSLTLVVLVNRDFPNGVDINNRATISDAKPGKEKNADAVTKVVQTPEGSIGDTVWYDANRNGIQEPGEPGLANVGLVLYSAGPDGQCGTADDVALANAVTNSAGQYLFNELPAGVYCVKVLETTIPAGLVLTGGVNPHGPIVLAEGEDYRLADFGYAPTPNIGSIGDRVWSDVNGDGKQDPGEIGIGNVTLDLFSAGPDGQCGTADDLKIASTTTGPDGRYLFTGLPAGKYCVKVTDVNGVLTGLTLTGGTDPHGPIDLKAGQTYLDADFGYRGATTYQGAIGNLVFYDGNRNGVYEPGPLERGIAGVTLSLLSAGPDGACGTGDDVVIATTTTDANGNYLFSGLPDGNYCVVVTDLNGRLPGYTQTYGVPDTDNHGQVSPYAVTITGGNTVLTADFGYADGHLLTVLKVNNVPEGQPVEAGALMTYTIVYSASGREPAPNVMLKDPLPTQVDFVSASNGGVYDPATRLVTWSLGNLNPGDAGFVTLVVRVKKPLPNNSYIFNTVTIIDDARVMDEDTDTVRVHAEPILSLTKANNPTGEVKPGDTIRYTLCYANTGNGNATGVMLHDVIPTYTTYVPGSATGGGAYDPATRSLMWNLGTVGPDANGCFDFQVTVDMTLPGVTEVNQGWRVDNVAHLSSNELPRLTANTSNPLNATVRPTLTKVNNPSGEVKPGDSIRYTLCYANNGTANLTGVRLTDVIPVNTTYVPGSATGGAIYDEATRTLTWNLGVVGPSVSACLDFQVTVNMTIVGITGPTRALSFEEWSALAINNTATLRTDQVPDKTATVSNPLNATVDLAIFKAVNTAFRHTGETVVFTLTVTNRGNAEANDVVITDGIHPKLEMVTLATSKGTASYDAASRLWTVNIGKLAPNETVTIVITGLTVRVAPTELPYQITNVGTVAFREGAPRNSNQVTVDVVYFLPGEIPEPGTWLLLGSGLAGLAGYARMRVNARRRKS